jgi:hypothetical protein
MIESKVFEIRDHATFMVGVATKLDTADREDPDCNEGYLLSRIGYKPGCFYPVVLYIETFAKTAHADYNAWSDKRAIPTAHKFITEHWDELESGDVVDVRFILEETNKPCESERTQWLNWIMDHPETQLPTT